MNEPRNSSLVSFPRKLLLFPGCSLESTFNNQRQFTAKQRKQRGGKWFQLQIRPGCRSKCVRVIMSNQKCIFLLEKWGTAHRVICISADGSNQSAEFVLIYSFVYGWWWCRCGFLWVSSPWRERARASVLDWARTTTTLLLSLNNWYICSIYKKKQVSIRLAKWVRRDRSVGTFGLVYYMTWKLIGTPRWRPS